MRVAAMYQVVVGGVQLGSPELGNVVEVWCPEYKSTGKQRPE